MRVWNKVVAVERCNFKGDEVRRCCVVVLAAGVAGGCQTAATSDIVPGSIPRVAITDAQRKALEQAVRVTLKDPESARFGEVIAGTMSSGQTMACGWVNAKNSFGGYVGNKLYSIVINTDGSFGPVVLDGPQTSGASVLCSWRDLVPKLG